MFIYVYKYVCVCVCVCVCVYIYIYICIYIYMYIGIMVGVFTNSLGDRGSMPGQILPKTQKMVLNASLHNTQHYEIWIKT